MLSIKKTIKQISGCNPNMIPEHVLNSTEPLVLKGLVKDWPLTKAGIASDIKADAYIRQFYQNTPIGAFYGTPDIKGRFFYNDDFSGFNFQKVQQPLDTILDKIHQHSKDACPPSFYIGSTWVNKCFTGLEVENNLSAINHLNPLMSIWIGNQNKIPAHYDLPDNIACNLVGKRKFTLFPPEQLENLYIGPLDFTPSGQAISLVNFEQPDFNKHPKFHIAIKSALTAELEPGDALFIPSMWWHYVESLGKFNVLVNYWWRNTPAYMGPPIDALNHAFLTLRNLPNCQKKAWEGLFKHYIFNSDPENFDHIPENAKGILAPLDELTARKIRAQLLNKLNR